MFIHKFEIPFSFSCYFLQFIFPAVLFYLLSLLVVMAEFTSTKRGAHCLHLNGFSIHRTKEDTMATCIGGVLTGVALVEQH